MEIINGLGQLYDPLKVNPEIDISDFDDQKLYILLRNMCCIRIAERIYLELIALMHRFLPLSWT